MGYWEQHKDKKQSWKEWASKQYSWENENIKHTVIDCSSLVGFKELYVLCERFSKLDGVKYRYCLVVIVRQSKNYYGQQSYMMKEMDETMMPYYFNCPKRILKQLSPVRKLRVMGDSFRCSKEWRKTCWLKFKRS